LVVPFIKVTDLNPCRTTRTVSPSIIDLHVFAVCASCSSRVVMLGIRDSEAARTKHLGCDGVCLATARKARGSCYTRSDKPGRSPVARRANESKLSRCDFLKSRRYSEMLPRRIASRANPRRFRVVSMYTRLLLRWRRGGRPACATDRGALRRLLAARSAVRCA